MVVLIFTYLSKNSHAFFQLSYRRPAIRVVSCNYRFQKLILLFQDVASVVTFIHNLLSVVDKRKEDVPTMFNVDVIFARRAQQPRCKTTEDIRLFARIYYTLKSAKYSDTNVHRAADFIPHWL